MRKEIYNIMDNKDLETMTLAEIHSKILLLQSGILSFEDWRKDMLAWANWYLKQKERPMLNIDRQGSEEKAS